MPDPRFFDSLPALSVAELAGRVGGEVVRGGDRQVSAWVIVPMEFSLKDR